MTSKERIQGMLCTFVVFLSITLAVLLITLMVSNAEAQTWEVRNPDQSVWNGWGGPNEDFGLEARHLFGDNNDNTLPWAVWDFDHPQSNLEMTFNSSAMTLMVRGEVYGGKAGAKGLWDFSGGWVGVSQNAGVINSMDTSLSRIVITPQYSSSDFSAGDSFPINFSILPGAGSVEVVLSNLTGASWVGYQQPDDFFKSSDFYFILVPVEEEECREDEQRARAELWKNYAKTTVAALKENNLYYRERYLAWKAAAIRYLARLRS